MTVNGLPVKGKLEKAKGAWQPPDMQPGGVGAGGKDTRGNVECFPHQPDPGGVIGDFPVVLVGSSILAQWDGAAEHLAPYPVVNRAVGGTMTGDQVTRFEETFASVRPMMVVYYCGSNDLINGQEPGTVAPNVVAFDRLLRDRFPGVPMIFVSSMKSPDRRHWWDRVDQYNERVKAYLSNHPDRHFFDLHPAIHDAAGEPRMELFQPDQLHLMPTAYHRLGRLFQPYLARLLQVQNGWSAQ